MNSLLFFLADPDKQTEIATIISIITVAVLVVLLVILCTRKNATKSNNTRALVYAAICISASFVLSFIKLFRLPFDGSITLASLVPIVIYSYVFGFRRGLLAGIIYGLLQFIQGPMFLTPIQFILDYILAFASISLAGVFKKVLKENLAVILGLLLVGFVRLTMHTLAGIIFFNAGWVYPELPSSNAFVYSLVYNIIYILPDIAIAIAAMCALLFTGSFKRLKTFMENSARIISEEQPLT